MQLTKKGSFYHFNFEASWQVYDKNIRERILGALQRAGWTTKKRGDIRLALTEAVSNAVTHGNKYQGDIDLFYKIEDSKLIVILKDEGQGFDWRNVPDPTAEENLNKNCGRGILLMKYVTKRFQYNEKGNCLMMMFSS